jgi:hypothetical protein
MPLGGQARLSERLLVEVGCLGETLVDPGIHDPGPVGDQLHPVDPYLEVVVSAQRVDLLLRALNQDEAAQLRGLRLEDGDVETLDLPILCEALEGPGLIEQVERLSLAPLRR